MATGPLPKHPSARRRRNQTSTARVLSLVHDTPAPPLPTSMAIVGRDDWHELTLSWWAAIWASPMAPEFERVADLGELFKLAALEDDFWSAEKPRERLVIAAEIRLQRQCFGLTPLDRRRLQWEIDRGEQAEDKTVQRRQTKRPAKSADPRSVLAG